MSEAADADVLGDGSLNWRSLARQFGIGLVALTVAIGLVGYLLAAPVEQLSRWCVDQFGLAGLAIGVLITDTTVFTNEPLMVIALAGGIAPWKVCGVTALASVAAGPLGYACGMAFGRFGAVQRWLDRTQIRAVMRRYGLATVIFAALTPLPFSAATWAAGATRTPFWKLLVGSLFRIPKTVFYFLLVSAVWSVAS